MGILASQLYSGEIVLGANIGAICKEKGQWRWPSGKLTSFPLLFPSIECLCVEKIKLNFQLKALIVTSSAIDKKLEINKKLENKLEIYKKSRN